jgi:DNA helicase HerA-like ATPase
VYLADPAIFGELISNSLGTSDKLTLELGTLDAGAGIPLRLQPEKIFGRLCGIFGATGGGKSWTLATVVCAENLSAGVVVVKSAKDGV